MNHLSPIFSVFPPIFTCSMALRCLPQFQLIYRGFRPDLTQEYGWQSPCLPLVSTIVPGNRSRFDKFTGELAQVLRLKLVDQVFCRDGCINSGQPWSCGSALVIPSLSTIHFTHGSFTLAIAPAWVCIGIILAIIGMHMHVGQLEITTLGSPMSLLTSNLIHSTIRTCSHRHPAPLHSSISSTPTQQNPASGLSPMTRASTNTIMERRENLFKTMKLINDDPSNAKGPPLYRYNQLAN